MSKLRYIAYVRKSTESEERQVMSHAAQTQKIKEYFSDLHIVKWMPPESQSAFKPGRPIFQQMIDLIDADKADAIVAWHPDRLSRNEIDASSITYRIRQGIIKDLKFASGMGFENTPEGMMMLQMTQNQSQYYSSKLSKDVKRGISQKVRTGQVTGVAPEGYINDPVAKMIKPDELRFPLIRQAFDMYLTGNYSVQQILTKLNDEWGYITIKRKKVGGTKLNRATLYRMFRNPRYAGWVPDPYEDGKFHKATYRAMITMEEYDQVQKLLGNKGKPRLCASKQFALKGFIRCGECGCMITAETKQKKLKNGNINYHTYYHCTKKKPCSQKGVKEDELFKLLDEFVGSYEIDPRLYDFGMQALEKMASEEVGQRDDIQTMQFESIKSIQQQLDKLLRMATKGLISEEEYAFESKPLRQELELRQQEQADTADRAKNWYEYIGKTLHTLTNANQKFLEGDLADKREILMAIGQNPVLLDRTLQLTVNNWLIPIKNEAKSLKGELDKVRTAPQQIREAAEETIRNTWLGMRDSNPRSRDQNPLPYHLANPH